MPALFAAGNQSLNHIRSLAKQGDQMATVLMSLLNNTYYAAMTFGAEATGGAAANTVRVLVQITDQDGNAVSGVKNVLFTSVPVSGAGTMTDGGFGVIQAGSGTKQMWMQSDSSGRCQVDVLNAVAETNLLKAELDNGTCELAVLTFI